jgi:conjugative relaxase-like TrwC/TraI family protein
VAGGEGRVAGFDLTFSAPKSVSVLWALHPDAQVRAAVAAAHDVAVGDALGFLESDALRARRGNGGGRRVEVEGLVAAGFGHRSSRAGDPQLHTHVVAANLVRDRSGRWSAPDSRAVYRHARTAGFVYQARLRHQLTQSLGVGWAPVRSGQGDLAGLGRDTVEAFSARRAEIAAALAQRGLSSAKAARIATLDTRPAKPGPATVGLFERWQDQAAALDVAVTGLVGPARQAHIPADLAERLVGSGGLTAQASSFDRRDLIRAAAQACRDGATLAGLETVAAEVVARAGTVELTDPDGSEVAARRWTTVELLAVEAEVIRSADRAALAGWAAADPAAVSDALAARPTLTGEQADLVSGVCGSRSGVVCVIGKAGTGKTFALDAARAAWDNDGYPVIGAALSARAAAELQAGSAIPSTTVARLLADLDRPEARPPSGSVIVIDEAGMVGTRHLHRLLTDAGRWGWKVVLVGDARQLPEIDAGGSFAHLCGRAPTWTLSANLRQAEAWERTTLDQLRDHQPGPAISAYHHHGRVIVAATAAALRQEMVADWHHARSVGNETLMLAVRRAEVEALNTAAQAHRAAAGELDPATVANVAGRAFMVGDDAICTRNDRRAGLTNGLRLTLARLDPATAGIQGVTGDGRTVTIPWVYAQAGQLQLGYALTVHKAQGVTVDQAFLLGDDRLFAEAGYVGLSRARQSNRLYVVAQPDPDRTPAAGHPDIDHVIAALGVSRAQPLSTSHTRPDHSDRTLVELIGDRDRLLEAICADMPPDPTGRLVALDETRRAIDTAPPEAGWIAAARADTEAQARHLATQIHARHDWAAGHRRHGETLARTVATIDARIDAIHAACRVDPPSSVIDLLGPPPENPLERRRWERAAGPIAVWAETSSQPVEELAAGREPAAYPERGLWAQARAALEHHHHQLDRAHEKGMAL